MANFDIPDSPQYTSQIRKFEASDPAHADLFNAVLQQLITNVEFIRKWLADLKEVAFTGEYSDLTGVPKLVKNYNYNLTTLDSSLSAQSTLAEVYEACRHKGYPVSVYVSKSQNPNLGLPEGYFILTVDAAWRGALMLQRCDADGLWVMGTAGGGADSAPTGTWVAVHTENSASATVPKAAGTAAAGTEARYARGDHVHPLQTSVSGSSGSCTGNSATATKLKDARKVDGVSFDGSADVTHYATCSTAAGTAAKAVVLAGFVLAAGSRVTIKFTASNTAANPTLNVNSTGAKPIYYHGAAITAGYLATNRTYEFVYNGTQYELAGDVDPLTVSYNKPAAVASSLSYLAAWTAENDKPELRAVGIVEFRKFLGILSSAETAGTYLPKSGGTMTGTLTIATGKTLHLRSGAGCDIWSPTDNHMSIAPEGASTNEQLKSAISIGYSSGMGTYAIWTYTDNLYDLGMGSRRWKQIYAATSTISTSDERRKRNIQLLDESLTEAFIMGLNPISYIMADGDSGRTHYGMGAQSVERLMTDLGMTSMDFAGFIKAPKTREIEEEAEVEKDVNVEDEDGTVRTVKEIRKRVEQEIVPGEYEYGLRYEEFIAPVIRFCQVLHDRADKQQEEIKSLKAENQELKERMDRLERALGISTI